MFGAACDFAHDDARQAVFALEPHEMARVGAHRDDHAPLDMGDEIAPVFVRRRRQGRGRELEILRAVAIRADVERLAMMLDLVAMRGFARGDEPGRGARIGQIDQPDFRRVVAAHRNHAEAARMAAVQMHEPGGIEILDHQRIVFLRCPQPVTKNLRRAMIVVDAHIEERPTVGVPHDRAVAMRHSILEIASRGEIAHADREEFRALVVAAPGEQPVIRRMFGRAHVEEGLAFRLRVAIDQDLLRAAVTRAPADQLMLSAFAEARIIFEGTIRPGRVGIVFLDPPAQFLEQFGPQRLGRRHQRVAIGVLGVEMRANVGGRPGGVGENLLPIVRA